MIRGSAIPEPDDELKSQPQCFHMNHEILHKLISILYD